jgi:hypothetical protein
LEITPIQLVSEPRPPQTVDFYLTGSHFPFGRFITGVVGTVSIVLVFPVTAMVIALWIFSGELTIDGIEQSVARLAVAATVGSLAWTACFLAVLFAGTKVLLDERGVHLKSASEKRLFVWNKILAINVDDHEPGKCLKFRYSHRDGKELTYSVRIPTEQTARDVSEFLLVRRGLDASAGDAILR